VFSLSLCAFVLPSSPSSHVSTSNGQRSSQLFCVHYNSCTLILTWMVSNVLFSWCGQVWVRQWCRTCRDNPTYRRPAPRKYFLKSGRGGGPHAGTDRKILVSVFYPPVAVWHRRSRRGTLSSCTTCIGLLCNKNFTRLQRTPAQDLILYM
jgi:hypothetical protein